MVETKTTNQKNQRKWEFRSKECLIYLKQADVIVTNPPFSLFKELVSLLFFFSKEIFACGKSKCAYI